jgi:hypothetical protein
VLKPGCQGTNSARLFTPRKRKAASGFTSGLVSGHLTDLKIWRAARSGMSQLATAKISVYIRRTKTYEKFVSYSEMYSNFFKFYLNEMARRDIRWEIMKCKASLFCFYS